MGNLDMKKAARLLKIDTNSVFTEDDIDCAMKRESDLVPGDHCVIQTLIAAAEELKKHAVVIDDHTVCGAPLSSLGKGTIGNSAPCSKCGTSGYISYRENLGESTVECDRCSGSGIYSVKCKKCKGQGCKTCRGTGVFYPRSSDPDGDFEKYGFKKTIPGSKMPASICRKCLGIGNIKKTKLGNVKHRKCHVCKGNGHVRVDNPVMSKSVADEIRRKIVGK